MTGKEFYVGYFKKTSPGLARALQLIVFALGVVAVFIAFMVPFFYERSTTSNFEFGVVKQITGTLYAKPTPVLKVFGGIDQEGNTVTESVLLVNVGKAGVQDIVNELADSLSGKLNEYQVTLEGSLVYYDGMTLFEMTNGKNAIVNIEKSSPDKRRISGEAFTSLTGEILDAKCYLGVMKPGDGKIHAACAVRCISGGTQPLIKAGGHIYLLDNFDVEQHRSLVGRPVEVQGEWRNIDDLRVLKVSGVELASNPEQGRGRYLTSLDPSISLCGF